MPTISVFCSASDRIDDGYPSVAEALGREIVDRDYDLVYGGGSVGLMGAVARTVKAGGRRVTGIIPEKLTGREGAYELADELIVTDTMSERKRKIYARADAFVVLPGGFGTLEEFLEILTLRQLGYHDRPIVLLNHDGFFDTLLTFFDQLEREQFAHSDLDALITVAPTPEAALEAVGRELGNIQR